MIVAFFWILFLVLVAIMAHKRHRSMLGWVLFGVFFSPIFPILFLLALGSLPPPPPVETTGAYAWGRKFAEKVAK